MAKTLNVNLKMVCFDMDGTIADLYGVENWLTMLRNYNPAPYRVAKPMWDMEELIKVLMALQAKGVEIRIITWLSKDSTPAYDRAVRLAKVDWLRHYDFPFDHFHGVKYGATKADSIRKELGEGETAILIDDNAKVRRGWKMGETIDPTACDIIEVLKGLL